MLKTIYKYQLHSGYEEIKFFLAPSGLIPLKVDIQNDNIYLWAITTPDTKAKTSKYEIKTVGTGEKFNEKDLKGYNYVGTGQLSASNEDKTTYYFVLHFFMKENPLT